MASKNALVVSVVAPDENPGEHLYLKGNKRKSVAMKLLGHFLIRENTNFNLRDSWKKVPLFPE